MKTCVEKLSLHYMATVSNGYVSKKKREKMRVNMKKSAAKGK
jgi:hypothetical protein